MLGRKKEGSVVCPSCGMLVGVNDDECLNCGRRNPGLWGFAPLLARFGRGALDDVFIQFVTVVCALLYVASLLVDFGSIRMGGLLGFLSPSSSGLFLLGASGSLPVFEFNRWWTVLSATWLHGSLLHILFNMYAVRVVAPAIVEFYGLSRMIIIYTIAGATGFLATSVVGYALPFAPSLLRGASLTIGASGSILGLIGAVMYYGRRTGSRGVAQQVKPWLIYIAVFGLIVPGIDNWAHLGGFVGGYAVSMWLDPLHPERLDHTVVALLCLCLTGVAIVVSVIHGIQFL
jgi:rhomboid protease GluP